MKIVRTILFFWHKKWKWGRGSYGACWCRQFPTKHNFFLLLLNVIFVAKCHHLSFFYGGVEVSVVLTKFDQYEKMHDFSQIKTRWENSNSTCDDGDGKWWRMNQFLRNTAYPRTKQTGKCTRDKGFVEIIHKILQILLID